MNRDSFSSGFWAACGVLAALALCAMAAPVLLVVGCLMVRDDLPDSSAERRPYSPPMVASPQEPAPLETPRVPTEVDRAAAREAERRDSEAYENAPWGELSRRNFDRILIGNWMEDVEYALGSKGELLSENQIGDLKTQLYQWKDGRKVVRITFQDGKVVSKTQRGL